MLFRRRASPLASGALVEVGGHPVRLRVSARARRVSLRLDVRAGEVVAVAPSPQQLADAVAFAHTRADWIAARLAERPAAVGLQPGAVISVAGEPYRLDRAAMRIRPRLVAPTPEEGGRLLAYGEGEAFTRAVVRALRAEALARLTARTAHHCAALGHAVPAVSLQDARSRWGSCRQGTPARPAHIRYNWRLLMAPASVLDYVAAHEVAHLAEANHGPRFWAVVARLYGDPAPARGWLKANGAALHAVG
jgi:predicted metal-dependent hydrolase